MCQRILNEAYKTIRITYAGECFAAKGHILKIQNNNTNQLGETEGGEEQICLEEGVISLNTHKADTRITNAKGYLATTNLKNEDIVS